MHTHILNIDFIIKVFYGKNKILIFNGKYLFYIKTYGLCAYFFVH